MGCKTSITVRGLGESAWTVLRHPVIPFIPLLKMYLPMSRERIIYFKVPVSIYSSLSDSIEHCRRNSSAIPTSENPSFRFYQILLNIADKTPLPILNYFLAPGNFTGYSNLVWLHYPSEPQNTSQVQIIRLVQPVDRMETNILCECHDHSSISLPSYIWSTCS